MAHVSLTNGSFRFLSQGAIIQEFAIGGKNLVLSFAEPEPYLDAPYFGETIGRVANRIGDGLIKGLNGRDYQLTTNLADKHHLHGGTVGWGHKRFSEPQKVSRNGKDVVHFSYVSPDGEEGYPGTIELRLWYTPFEEEGGVVALELEYEAELVDGHCEETVVNVTNHSYFNLSETPTIEGTQVRLASDDYLVIDQTDVPTGVVGKFPGLAAERTFTLGAEEPSIDHCFVMDKDASGVPLDTRSRALRRLVHARHALTGINLEVHSTEPAFQFYTGDYVDVPASEHGSAKGARAGFCVEPGRFINAVNHPEWKHQVVLQRGQVWGSRILYKAWKGSEMI